MSNDFKVGSVLIDKILEHPNADRLEIATIQDMAWNVVVGKGEFKPGHVAIYIPTDSIVPPSVERALFGPDSKIGLTKGRVKTIRIRKAVSQGILAAPEKLGLSSGDPIGTDYAQKLGIEKYEPRAPQAPGLRGRKSTKRESNPNFVKYTDINRIQNYKTAFDPDDAVVATEKLHGSNFRAGWVRAIRPRGFFRRLWWDLRGLVGKQPEWEFVYGSHNVQLHDKINPNTYYDLNVWAKMVSKYNMKSKIPRGVTVFGEIIGPGVQKNYNYGIEEGDYEVVFFDVRDNQDGVYWGVFDAEEFITFEMGWKYVPILYHGTFKDLNFEQWDGVNSVYCPDQKIMEGVVVRHPWEDRFWGGRKVLKWISPAYDEKDDNTDFH